jgi:hypothetical protein
MEGETPVVLWTRVSKETRLTKGPRERARNREKAQGVCQRQGPRVGPLLSLVKIKNQRQGPGEGSTVSSRLIKAAENAAAAREQHQRDREATGQRESGRRRGRHGEEVSNTCMQVWQEASFLLVAYSSWQWLDMCTSLK